MSEREAEMLEVACRRASALERPVYCVGFANGAGFRLIDSPASPANAEPGDEQSFRVPYLEPASEEDTGG